MMTRTTFAAALICTFILMTNVATAQKEEVGFNALVAEKGAALEDGTGIVVMQPEAGTTTWMPDDNHPQFSGKNIVDGTGGGGVSGHATGVGQFFYGNTSSMSGGITDVTGYSAGDYINNVLGASSGADPMAQSFDVGNHSYVGRDSVDFQAPAAENILERFDFVINRDNTVMVVGADNGSFRPTPRILTPSYNSIGVGLSNGNHSQTLTPNYGAPRFATEIVVPVVTVTSNATPVVGSAAALLREAGSGTNFVQNEAIRAALFAGATKDEFAMWDKTSTRPIDEVFGFGELNILNSYHIFEGGEFDGSTTDPVMNSGLLGWDYGIFNGSDDLHYDFSIQAGYNVTELSAVLTWNIDIEDTNADPGTFTASRSLANLDLDLFDSSGSFLGSLLDSSVSTDYNHEHIYLQSLAAGDYTFRVRGDQATDFAFAWRITAVPEPSSSLLLVVGLVGVTLRRRRS